MFDNLVQPTTKEPVKADKEPTLTPTAPPATPPPTPPTPPPAPVAATPTVPTATELAEAVANRLKPPTPGAPQMTKEEQEEMFKVWQPSKDLHERLFAGGEKALGAFHEIRDGLMKQVSTMFFYGMTQFEQQITQRYARMEAESAQAAEAKHEDAFFTSFPELKEHKRLVDLVTADLISKGFRAASVAEAHNKVAEVVRGMFPNGNVPTNPTPSASGNQPSPSANDQKTPSPKPAQPAERPTMASLSSGGQGGNQRTSATATQQSKGHAVFS